MENYEQLLQLIKKILDFILVSLKGLTGEQIALISVFVSFIIYTLGKISELKMKKHEAKKKHYMKFIKMYEKMITQSSFDKSKIEDALIINMKSEFFELGSSLLLYGSKKLYRQYIFIREINENPIFTKRKYYDSKILIYLLGDIFRTIRKEVGLNTFDNITSVESLAFFINKFAYNPYTKKELYRAKCIIRKLKFEAFFIERTEFVYFNKILYLCILPVCGYVKIVLTYLLVIPILRLLMCIFPNLSSTVDDSCKVLEELREEKKKKIITKSN